MELCSSVLLTVLSMYVHPICCPPSAHAVHSRVRSCALCRGSCSDECGGIRRKHLSWCAQNQRFVALRSLTLSGTIASLAPHALI